MTTRSPAGSRRPDNEVDPLGVYRTSGSNPQPPQTVLTAVACTTSAQCAAVGSCTANDGAIAALAARTGPAGRRPSCADGPVQLDSVACPALGLGLAVGDGISER